MAHFFIGWILGNSKGRPLRWSIVFKLIQDEVKKINQSEYIIECIENISDIDFIVSDNPVTSYNNSKKELHKHDSDFSKENIMIFPINFKKIIIIYSSKNYVLKSNKISTIDVRLLNLLFLKNSDQNIIVSNSNINAKDFSTWAMGNRVRQSAEPEIKINKIFTGEKCITLSVPSIKCDSSLEFISYI